MGVELVYGMGELWELSWFMGRGGLGERGGG